MNATTPRPVHVLPGWYVRSDAVGDVHHCTPVAAGRLVRHESLSGADLSAVVAACGARFFPARQEHGNYLLPHHPAGSACRACIERLAAS